MRPSNSSCFLLPLLSALAAAQTSTLTHLPVTCGGAASEIALPGTPHALSANATGEVWAMLNTDSLRRYANNGTQVFASPTAFNGFDVAVTGANEAWVLSGFTPPSRLQRFSSGGTVVANFTSAVVGGNAEELATNAGGDAWVAGQFPSTVRRINATGVVLFNTAIGGDPCDIAVSPTGEAWVAMTFPNQLQKLSSTGLVLLTVALTGTPTAIDIDGNGNVAVVTSGPNQLRRFASNGAPGFTVVLPDFAGGVAFNGSSEAWVLMVSEARRFSSTGALLCTTSVPLTNGPMDVGGDNTVWLWRLTPPSVPVLTSVTPGTVLLGQNPTMTLTGSGFNQSSTVLLSGPLGNGSGLPLSITPNTITATFGTFNFSRAGTINVSVSTPPNLGFGGGTSASRPVLVGRVPAVAAYGSGCLGSNSLVPTLGSTTVPRVGVSVTSTITQARPAAVGILVFGVSRTTFQGQSLPFSLGSLGAPGCFLRASADLSTVFFVASGGGTASNAWSVPSSLSFVGMHVFQQAFLLDANGNALGLVTSAGLDFEIGNL